MANIDVKNIKTARRYAQALLDSAKEYNQVEKVYQDLKMIENTFNESGDLFDFLRNPVISFQDKSDVLEQVFESELNKETYNFLLILAENNRFDLFESVCCQYLKAMDELNNILKVKVVSAVNLKEDHKRKLIEKLEYKTSKTIVPEYIINPEIIGGLIIELEDRTIDSSIQSKLNNLKKQLI